MQLQAAIQATAVAMNNEARALQNQADVAIIEAMAPVAQAKAQGGGGLSFEGLSGVGSDLVIAGLVICSVFGMFAAIIILGRRAA